MSIFRPSTPGMRQSGLISSERTIDVPLPSVLTSSGYMQLSADNVGRMIAVLFSADDLAVGTIEIDLVNGEYVASGSHYKDAYSGCISNSGDYIVYTSGVPADFVEIYEFSWVNGFGFETGIGMGIAGEFNVVTTPGNEFPGNPGMGMEFIAAGGGKFQTYHADTFLQEIFSNSGLSDLPVIGVVPDIGPGYALYCRDGLITGNNNNMDWRPSLPLNNFSIHQQALMPGARKYAWADPMQGIPCIVGNNVVRGQLVDSGETIRLHFTNIYT